MQHCPNCGQENRPGTIFCEHCGFAIKAISIGTAKLGGTEELQAGSEQLSEEHIILLHVDGYPDPLTIQVIGQLVLGREEGPDSPSAFVSMEPYGAIESGVSRQHVQLTRHDDQLLIRDLGSTNHTFLNGQRLIEMRDYSLRDGDEIRLGKLEFRLFFK